MKITDMIMQDEFCNILTTFPYYINKKSIEIRKKNLYFILGIKVLILPHVDCGHT